MLRQYRPPCASGRRAVKESQRNNLPFTDMTSAIGFALGPIACFCFQSNELRATRSQPFRTGYSHHRFYLIMMLFLFRGGCFFTTTNTHFGLHPCIKKAVLSAYSINRGWHQRRNNRCDRAFRRLAPFLNFPSQPSLRHP